MTHKYMYTIIENGDNYNAWSHLYDVFTLGYIRYSFL